MFADLLCEKSGHYLDSQGASAEFEECLGSVLGCY